MAETRKFRVLHLTAGSDAGGLSRYLHELCTAMHALGHEVAIAGERGAWHNLFEGAPWPWIELPLKGGPRALWRSAATLEARLRERPVDLIHAHYRRTTLVSRLLKRRLGVPVLYTLHVTGIALGGLYRFLTDFGDHVHAPSTEAEEWLVNRAGLALRQVTVIPHGIEPAKFPLSDAADQRAARAELKIPEDATVAGFVGRFDYPKNDGWMLDLAAATRSKLPKLRVLMIGEGPHEPELRRRIRAEGLEGRVTILPYGDPRRVYRASDAILITSQAEGFSYVNTEAMSTGRAVLRTRTAGTTEQIVEGVTGRSVAIDREEFLKVAADMLAHRDRLQRLGAAGAQHMRKYLTFDRQLAATLDLYGRVAAMRGGTSR